MRCYKLRPFFSLIIIMINTSLEIFGFRNHEHTVLQWGKNVNVLVGPNGAGKTNILDAIHYLCMSRSFVHPSDLYAIRKGHQGFLIKGHFEGSIRSSFEVGCAYKRGEGKTITVNDSPLDRISDLIGMVPVISLAPDDKKLTAGGPVERRTFVDGMISQLSRSYLKDLVEYRRVIRQRNRVLSEVKDPEMRLMQIDAWDQKLIEVGSGIVKRRAEILSEFSGYLSRAYQKVASIEQQPSFRYQTFIDDPLEYSQEELQNQYRAKLREFEQKEADREQTLVGPHRDEIVFLLDDLEVRKFGSQGQHRMFALALKLAQLSLYAEKLDDLPILLLDDVFGDLDPRKTEIFLDALLSHEAQTFITAANPELILNLIPQQEEHQTVWQVENGAVRSYS